MNSSFWKRFSRNWPAMFGFAFLTSLTIIVFLAPLFYPGDPFQIVGKPFQAPFGDYLLGTDSLGRDVAAGIAHGGRTSLLIGLVATLVAMVFGTVLGAIAGFYRGRVDNF